MSLGQYHAPTTQRQIPPLQLLERGREMVFRSLLSGSDGETAREELTVGPRPPSQASGEENQHRQVRVLPRSMAGLLACPGGESVFAGSTWAPSPCLRLALAQPSPGQPYHWCPLVRARGPTAATHLRGPAGTQASRSRLCCGLAPLLPPTLPASFLLLPGFPPPPPLPLSLSPSSFFNLIILSGVQPE